MARRSGGLAARPQLRDPLRDQVRTCHHLPAINQGTLFVSEATVKTHVNRIFTKTGSVNRVQAIRCTNANGHTGSELR